MTPQIWSEKPLIKIKIPRRNVISWYKIGISDLSKFITNQKREFIDFRRDLFTSNDIDSQKGFIVKANLLLDPNDVWHEIPNNSSQKRQLDFIRQQMLSKMVLPNDQMNILPLVKDLNLNIDQISAIIVNFKKNNEVNKNWAIVSDIIANANSQNMLDNQYIKHLEDYWNKNTASIRIRWEDIDIKQKGKYEIREILVLGQKNLIQFSMKRFNTKSFKVNYLLKKDNATEKTISDFKNK